jgi:hypothetical protein
MSRSKKPNTASIVGTCAQRLTALKAHLPPTVTTIPVNGVQMKVGDVTGAYQSCIDERTTLNSQRAEVKATLASVAAADIKRRTVDVALKAWVVNQYGADSKEAHDFGFPAPKAASRTVDSKATAIERGQATRKARHTMGSKQKEDVKGTMVVLVPPPQASTPNPVVAPAVNGVATTANGTHTA